MDRIEVVRSDEVLDVHRHGQRTGFIAGVIFCIAAKYLYQRRQEVIDPEKRTRN
jgi:hypothetical protein